MDLLNIIYIKELLDRNVAEKEEAYKEAKEAKNNAEDASGVTWNTEDSRCTPEVIKLREACNKASYELHLAEVALAAFVHKDWN